MPYTPADVPALDAAVKEAYANREDLRGQQEALDAARAAEQGRHRRASALAARRRELGRDRPDRVSTAVPTYTVGATVRVPLFSAGSDKARSIEAAATLRRRSAELEETRAKVYYEVQAALLDVDAAQAAGRSPRATVELADEQLVQARDRFGAGVADTIEVVQAQEAVASAHDVSVASLYGYNAAQASLAAALGLAEEHMPRFLGASEVMADTSHPVHAPARSRLKLFLTIALVVAGAAAGSRLVDAQRSARPLTTRRSTGTSCRLAARVQGTVLRGPCQDNQEVKAGDVLVELDPRDYELAVGARRSRTGRRPRRGRRGRLRRAGRQRRVDRQSERRTRRRPGGAAPRSTPREPAVNAATARRAAAEARVRSAETATARPPPISRGFEPLIKKEEISRAQYDAAVAAADTRAGVGRLGSRRGGRSRERCRPRAEPGRAGAGRTDRRAGLGQRGRGRAVADCRQPGARLAALKPASSAHRPRSSRRS